MPAGSGQHRPVMLEEVRQAAQARPGQRWIDGTFGRGGHSRALLEAGAQVLGLDRDGAAEPAAQALAQEWPGNFNWKQQNFAKIEQCSHEHGWEKVSGILLDLGVSSPQFETAERGFSLQLDGPLDMRMDQRETETAADIINHRSEQELADLFYELGDEKESRRAARALVSRRRLAPFRTTADLAGVVAALFPHRRARGIHPATKIFQSLRLAVNREPEALRAALAQAPQLLEAGGVLAVISFHSGEDRVVKRFLREQSSPFLETPEHPNTLPNTNYCFEQVRRYLPTEAEIAANPRARSARLRVARRNRKPSA